MKITIYIICFIILSGYEIIRNVCFITKRYEYKNPLPKQFIICISFTKLWSLITVECVYGKVQLSDFKQLYKYINILLKRNLYKKIILYLVHITVDFTN